MKFSQLILLQGLTLCEVDPILDRTSTFSGCIILAIYVDDILITRNNINDITQVKDYLHQDLTIQDLCTSKYFLGIKIAYLGTPKLVLNQHKYVQHRLLGCKLPVPPIDSKPKFWDSSSSLLADVHAYHELVGKVIYVTITRHDITYSVGSP